MPALLVLLLPLPATCLRPPFSHPILSGAAFSKNPMPPKETIPTTIGLFRPSPNARPQIPPIPGFPASCRWKCHREPLRACLQSGSGTRDPPEPAFSRIRLSPVPQTGSTDSHTWVSHSSGSRQKPPPALPQSGW